MTRKPLLELCMAACLALTATAPTFAFDEDRFDVAQASDQRWHQPCETIRDRRERARCFNGARPNEDADWGTAIGVGIIGLTLGAIIAGAASSAENDRPRPMTDYERWLAYCAGKYRSFDPASGTFLSHDGRRYRCQ
ncbi:BA14K family protein [Devosia lacusdianchii]|uniref:BA14K family protein n=1 Tax=Devosia lacusdianchii TaxID=2917991 RepID=UPI001F053D64|nr:BA14K family protein [Devosia sp. JXJ CY 41]